ncbi:FecR family protein [Larkinella bovis]|uniref:FecR family protein n=1 Tax=Larkinella bovis TaxID=683041 RepID=A0ABW0IFT9_9BACT
MSVNKNLLWRYFSGNVTLPERQRVTEWLRENSNLERYYQALEEWEQENLQFETDTDAAIQRYLHSSDKNNRPPVPAPQRIDRPLGRFFRNSYRWMAAAVVVLLSMAAYVWQDFLLYQTHTTGYGQVRSLILEDGSRVTLNANSRLSIPRWPSADREVFLKGEAEFSVIHTHDHRRFLVKTDDQLQVEVLGTEFVVYSRNRGSKVALTKGKVRLRSLKDTHAKPLTILPGDVVTVSEKGTFQVQSRQELAPYTAWKNHLFVFEATPLQDITAQIKDIFGVSILLSDDELAHRTLTGAFEAETADELVQALTKVMNLRQVQQDTVILLQPAPTPNPVQLTQ